ncbi:unnamed protein product [Closterium sp. NIES-54]
MTSHLGALILQTDLTNAFNSISRSAIVEAFRGSPLEGLLPLTKVSYGAPSLLYLDNEFHSPPLTSETGVRQGDPLGPLLFAEGINPALIDIAAAYLQAGLIRNPAKCAAWSARGADGCVLPEGVPFYPSGLRVLGSYIGPTAGAAAFLRGQLETLSSPLPLIAGMYPQLASLLLTKCISQRISYLARTTPLYMLP